ncbi:MAG: purR [Pseudomonas sp.]|nr:purR [Pseudomonas sp.]
MQQRPTTLRAIAQQLGVHVSTVSRVLNGPADGAERAASKETVERIRLLAQGLGYLPNHHATSLKTRRSQELAILVPQLSDIVLASIYAGVDEAASAAGYTSFVANTLDIPERQRTLAERALARNVDGLILCDTHCGLERGFIDELAERQVPFVLLNRIKGDHCSVSSDDAGGARLAARHLLDLGHRRLAVMTGLRHSSNNRARADHFVACCREYGVIIDPSHCVAGSVDVDDGYRIGNYLLDQPVPPTAVFAVNDMLAVGMMSAMRERGLEPGRDIALVGYNDIPLAAHLSTPLTSISSSMELQGAKAVEMLLRLIRGEAVESYVFPALMTVRASSRGF